MASSSKKFPVKHSQSDYSITSQSLVLITPKAEGLVTLNHPTFNHATVNHRHIITWTVNNASYNQPTVKYVDI